jgi:hypothetical protein
MLSAIFGLRELLDFLSRRPSPSLSFVNSRFMFNGDRLAFVKGYKLDKISLPCPALTFLRLPCQMQTLQVNP